jgi:hypothetical protein
MADEVNLSDKSLDKLAERLAKVQGNSKGSSGSGSNTPKDSGALGSATDKLAATFSGPLSTAAGGVGVAYNALKDTFKDGMGTWQELSKSGANFNNDIIGMTAAAAGTRMSLGEFADVIQKNAGNFTGLGGSVSKGAQAFATLSKDMADSGVTDQLKMMGMTSKDINNVLAIQLAGQQTINMNDEAAKKRAIASATAMATEMDLMSKLTGKSRTEQEEIMKKAQADMQAEAKLRLLTMGKSEEEAAAIRNNYYAQQKEAELRGQGQLFKEVFATGTIQSEAAANQVAISGREAQMTMAAARASQEGDAKAASEYQKQARIENSKNMQDANKLQLATLGDQTAAGKTQMESMTANAAYTRAENAVTAQLQREGTLKNLSEDEKRRLVQERMIEDAKKEQTDKKPGSESTEAMVKLAARTADAESALMNKLVVPMNEQVGPALKKFNDGLLNSKDKLADGTVVTKSKALETGVTKGLAAGQDPNDKRTLAERAKEPREAFSVEGAGKVIGETAGVALKLGIVPALDAVADKLNGLEPKKRAEGGVINNPELAIIGEAGKEYVVPEDKMQTLMQNVKLDGLQSAAKALSGGDKGGGVNIGEISNLVKTTISSASGPTGGAASAPLSKNEKFQTADWADATQEEIAKGLEGSKKQLTMWTNDAQVAEQKIAEIKANGAKRQLTSGEEFELDVLEKEKAKNQRAIEYHQSTINVLSNLDEYKARLETESKQKVVSATEAATKVAEDLGLSQIETAKKSADEQKTVLTEHQQTTLKYAYTDAEGKKMQLENAKNLVDSEKNAIAEKNKQIEEIQAAADGRELSNREKSRIERLQKEIEGSKETLSYREQDLEVYANLDKLKAENETTAKESSLESITSANARQLEIQAEATRRIEQLKKDGVVTDEETAKVTEEVVTEMRKKAEAQVADIKKMETSAKGIPGADELKKTETPTKGIPDFSSMFGAGGGFLEKLNAQIKDAKPVEIKNKEEANKASPKTTATAVKEDEEKKKAEEAKAKAAAGNKPTGTVEAAKPSEVTMKDLHASLEHLNKSMTTLINYSQQTASAAQAQVKATKGLSSNKFA